MTVMRGTPENPPLTTTEHIEAIAKALRPWCETATEKNATLSPTGVAVLAVEALEEAGWLIVRKGPIEEAMYLIHRHGAAQDRLFDGIARLHEWPLP